MDEGPGLTKMERVIISNVADRFDIYASAWIERLESGISVLRGIENVICAVTRRDGKSYMGKTASRLGPIVEQILGNGYKL